LQKLSLANTGITATSLNNIKPLDYTINLVELDISGNPLIGSDFSENYGVAHFFSIMSGLRKLIAHSVFNEDKIIKTVIFKIIIESVLKNINIIDVDKEGENLAILFDQVKKDNHAFKLGVSINSSSNNILYLTHQENIPLIFSEQNISLFKNNCTYLLNKMCHLGQPWLNEILYHLEETIYLLEINSKFQESLTVNNQNIKKLPPPLSVHPANVPS
jgi:hypothetical protein